jgi:hypothetical protein
MSQDRSPESSSIQAIANAFDLTKPRLLQEVYSTAAQFIGAYSNVLEVGSASADFRRALPERCSYRSISLESISGGDLWRTAFEDGEAADVVALFDMDRLGRAADLLRNLRRLGCSVVFSYSARTEAESRSPARVDALLREAGFWLEHHADIADSRVFKAAPGAAAPRSARPKKVLVLSYYNDHNFGDRLGYHVINSLLPAGTLVTHASVVPWTAPEKDFDLIILGIGNSLNAATVQRPELHRVLERAPHTLGIFGTQYRYQYRDLIDPTLMDRLLGNLTTWWARYREDIQAFGRGRNNVRHLGDFLISAFPLATPTRPNTLEIQADIKDKDVPLDRVIQQIQAYQRVSTARIHPMLCALTSAEEVAFQEQQEDPNGRSSGKFRSQLYDIFGRTFEENEFFKVDREAVARYKGRVEANMSDLRAQISDLLA